MSSEELRAQAQTASSQIMIAGALWLVAFMIIMVAAVTWIVLAVMAGDYFTNAKAVRDAAEAGSGLLSQQGSIEAVKAWVLPLTFVGLATFIAGFGFAFANILTNIRLRANTMAAALPALKARKTAPQA
ncbi:MAG: hypothetical protein IH862_03095 [Chloroflexi bacterium]|nr:hypothetical protein [Chloroflexota bacterium]